MNNKDLAAKAFRRKLNEMMEPDQRVKTYSSPQHRRFYDNKADVVRGMQSTEDGLKQSAVFAQKLTDIDNMFSGTRDDNNVKGVLADALATHIFTKRALQDAPEKLPENIRAIAQKFGNNHAAFKLSRDFLENLLTHSEVPERHHTFILQNYKLYGGPLPLTDVVSEAAVSYDSVGPKVYGSHLLGDFWQKHIEPAYNWYADRRHEALMKGGLNRPDNIWTTIEDLHNFAKALTRPSVSAARTAASERTRRGEYAGGENDPALKNKPVEQTKEVKAPTAEFGKLTVVDWQNPVKPVQVPKVNQPETPKEPETFWSDELDKQHSEPVEQKPLRAGPLRKALVNEPMVPPPVPSAEIKHEPVSFQPFKTNIGRHVPYGKMGELFDKTIVPPKAISPDISDFTGSIAVDRSSADITPTSRVIHHGEVVTQTPDKLQKRGDERDLVYHFSKSAGVATRKVINRLAAANERLKDIHREVPIDLKPGEYKVHPEKPAMADDPHGLQPHYGTQFDTSTPEHEVYARAPKPVEPTPQPSNLKQHVDNIVGDVKQRIAQAAWISGDGGAEPQATARPMDWKHRAVETPEYVDFKDPLNDLVHHATRAARQGGDTPEKRHAMLAVLAPNRETHALADENATNPTAHAILAGRKIYDAVKDYPELHDHPRVVGALYLAKLHARKYAGEIRNPSSPDEQHWPSQTAGNLHSLAHGLDPAIPGIKVHPVLSKLAQDFRTQSQRFDDIGKARFDREFVKPVRDAVQPLKDRLDRAVAPVKEKVAQARDYAAQDPKLSAAIDYLKHSSRGLRDSFASLKKTWDKQTSWIKEEFTPDQWRDMFGSDYHLTAFDRQVYGNKEEHPYSMELRPHPRENEPLPSLTYGHGDSVKDPTTLLLADLHGNLQKYDGAGTKAHETALLAVKRALLHQYDNVGTTNQEIVDKTEGQTGKMVLSPIDSQRKAFRLAAHIKTMFDHDRNESAGRAVDWFIDHHKNDPDQHPHLIAAATDLLKHTLVSSRTWIEPHIKALGTEVKNIAYDLVDMNPKPAHSALKRGVQDFGVDLGMAMHDILNANYIGRPNQKAKAEYEYQLDKRRVDPVKFQREYEKRFKKHIERADKTMERLAKAGKPYVPRF